MSGRARRKGEFPSERDASPGSGTSACRRRTRMEGHSNLCLRPRCRPPPDPAPRRAQAPPWRSPWPGPSVGVRGLGPTRQTLLPGTCPLAWPPKRPSQAASKSGSFQARANIQNPRKREPSFFPTFLRSSQKAPENFLTTCSCPRNSRIHS